MSNRPLSWKQIVSGARVTTTGFKWEGNMSNLKYAILDEEIEEIVSSAWGTDPKPFVVAQRNKNSDNALTRRVEAALDREFANGSMPA